MLGLYLQTKDLWPFRSAERYLTWSPNGFKHLASGYFGNGHTKITCLVFHKGQLSFRGDQLWFSELLMCGQRQRFLIAVASVWIARAKQSSGNGPEMAHAGPGGHETAKNGLKLWHLGHSHKKPDESRKAPWSRMLASQNRKKSYGLTRKIPPVFRPNDGRNPRNRPCRASAPPPLVRPGMKWSYAKTSPDFCLAPSNPSFTISLGQRMAGDSRGIRGSRTRPISAPGRTAMPTFPPPHCQQRQSSRTTGNTSLGCQG